MRSLNSYRNASIGLISQITSLIFSIISRTIFIKILGIEVLGVNSLFLNIISILSLSELGISTAIIFNLYKPLEQNEYSKIIKIMNFYKKSYRYIALVILILGLTIIPFVNNIATTEVLNLKLIFLLFIIQTVSSYLFNSYKKSLLIADQKNYIISIIHIGYILVLNISQITILFITKSFELFLIIPIVFIIIENIIIGMVVDRKYPYINDNEFQLGPSERKLIFKHIYATFMSKFSGIILGATDNILISYFIDIISVGIYSNYMLIVNAINTLLNVIFNSVVPSIGNLNVNSKQEKKYQVYKTLNFITFWVYCFCSISLWVLLNPFIEIWIGGEYILENKIIFFIIINFLITGLINPTIIYKDACGLFWKGRYRPLISAIINLLLSLIMIKKMGILGVLLGTFISRISTTVWFDAYILHKYIFKDKVKSFLIKIFYRIVFVVFLMIFTNIVIEIIFRFEILAEINIQVAFIIKGIVCFILVNVILYLLSKNKDEFKIVKNMILNYINLLANRK